MSERAEVATAATTTATHEGVKEEAEEEALEATLDWIANSTTLKWIFVGGKGGVGKTTVSCSLAVQLARRTPSRRILLISTDPAHNTSDAFAQRFTRNPTPVAGCANLDVMEIDSSAVTSAALGAQQPSDAGASQQQQQQGGLGGILSGIMPDIQEMAGSMPGIDEAMSFAEIMRQVRSLEYDLVLFDTAPTGHTLRLLGFPSMLQKSLGKVLALKSRFSGLFNTITRSIIGGDSDADAMAAEQQKHLEELLKGTEEVTRQFRDPSLTTFVPVMIAEFLSLYETERLVQELAKFDMDVSSVVINQLVPETCAAACGMCSARAKMQKRYVDQACDLYGQDFHIVTLPLLDHEVRGVDQLADFGSRLFKQQ